MENFQSRYPKMQIRGSGTPVGDETKIRIQTKIDEVRSSLYNLPLLYHLLCCCKITFFLIIRLTFLNIAPNPN